LREKRELIEVVQSMISISRQCELLGIRRSSYYYCPQKDSSYNLMLMKLIDEQYTRRPFYGVPRMTAWLRREGHLVNPKRVRRLMRLMRLEAIYPKPRLSLARNIRYIPTCLRESLLTIRIRFGVRT